MKKSKIQCFKNARIVRDHKIERGELWVKDGKITAPQTTPDDVIDMEGKILAPGFIDLQINGGFGCDFSRNPEQIALVAKKLLQYGVTGFFPTVITSSPRQYKAILPFLQPKSFGKEGAAILGIHLEGPFFSSSYAGAHDPAKVLSNFNGSLEDIYGNLAGVKIVTLAPEIPGGMHLIQELKKRGILVAVGHSSANSEQMKSAIHAGAALTTHLFNAMPAYHHRNPGIIGAALLNPSLSYTLIVDRVHICDETVMLSWRCHPEGLILITDATEALGLPNGTYKLGTMDIDVIDDHVYLKGTHTIAGSNLSINKAVQNLRAITKCSLVNALEAASLKPAKCLGIYPMKGSLERGADADFILLSDDLEVEATYIQGELAWKN